MLNLKSFASPEALFCSLLLMELTIIAIIGLSWKIDVCGSSQNENHALTFSLLKTMNKECFMKKKFSSMKVSAQEKQYQRPS